MKVFFILGAILAFLSVALGAFGAHVLTDKFKEPKYAQNWNTAAQYQMYHGLGLILIGILSSDSFFGSTSLLTWAGYMMFAGVIFFSGSLYVLSVTGMKKLGAIAPIGGVSFLAAWFLVMLQAF